MLLQYTCYCFKPRFFYQNLSTGKGYQPCWCFHKLVYDIFSSNIFWLIILRVLLSYERSNLPVGLDIYNIVSSAKFNSFHVKGLICKCYFSTPIDLLITLEYFNSFTFMGRFTIWLVHLCTSRSGDFLLNSYCIRCRAENFFYWKCQVLELYITLIWRRIITFRRMSFINECNDVLQKFFPQILFKQPVKLLDKLLRARKCIIFM